MVATLEIRTQLAASSRLSEVDFANLQFGRTMSDHMFMADYRDGEWHDCQLLPFGDLPMSPALSALHYGQAIFEGMKAYRTEAGKVVMFRPLENWARFNRSAARMCMPQIPEEIFIGGLQKLIETDQAWVPSDEGASLYLRPVMFGTDPFVGLRPSQTYKFVIFACPVRAFYSEPVRVKIETYYTRAANGGVGTAKNAGNYGASMLPTKLANEEGYHQLIWTDSREHKYVEEAGSMNLMFRIGGTLLTAPVGDTILDGVTRKSVLQVAREMGVVVEERRIAIDEILAAIKNGTLTEAFGVGTAATVAPICHIGYQEADYELADLGEDSFALQAKKYLTDLCKGRVADTHGWLMEVA